MRSQSKYLISMCSVIFSSAAMAAWSSGGGDVFTDTTNPWFVQNTTDVSYCVAIDEVNFGQTADVARSKIKAAIAYWQSEFARAPAADSNFPAVKVGTQNFSEVPCDQDPDIRFQFGVLSKRQAEYLRTPTKIVGVAVRTSYDEVQLRGRGFVYISPSSGPLAMTGPDMAVNPWQMGDGQLLELALTHEMGHVFGVQHIETFPSIMAEDFPSNLVQASMAPFFAAAQGRPFMFIAPFEQKGTVIPYTDCVDGGLGDEISWALGVNKDWQCLTLKFTDGLYKLEIYASETPTSPPTLVASSNGSISVNTDGLSSSDPLVLSAHQKVYPTVPATVQTMPTYGRETLGTITYSIDLTTTPARTTQIMIDYTTTYIYLSGMNRRGELMLDIFNTTPWQFPPSLSAKRASALAHRVPSMAAPVNQ